MRLNRTLAAAAFAAAFALGSFALAAARAPDAPAPMAVDAPTADASLPASEGLFVRAALALRLAGYEVERGAEVARETTLAHGLTPSPPRVARGIDADASAVAPLALAADLDLGRDALPPAHTAEAEPTATTQAASVRAVHVLPAGYAAAAAVVAALGVLAWFWPTVKKALLAPLFARITQAEVFQNDVRERIFQLIKTEPGISASEIGERVAVSWGTTIYHLDVLEQNRMVVSVRDGRYRRYFENGAAEKREAVSVLRNATTAAIVARVEAAPGLTQKELAREAGLTPQALHWHAERLLKAGVVTKVREGRVVKFYRAG